MAKKRWKWECVGAAAKQLRPNQTPNRKPNKKPNKNAHEGIQNDQRVTCQHLVAPVSLASSLRSCQQVVRWLPIACRQLSATHTHTPTHTHKKKKQSATYNATKTTCFFVAPTVEYDCRKRINLPNSTTTVNCSCKFTECVNVRFKNASRLVLHIKFTSKTVGHKNTKRLATLAVAKV